MPPFGKRWFRVLRELTNEHPIALLRVHWMMLNIGEDKRLHATQRREEIEYGGFFANPDVYAHVKGHSTNTGAFQIVYDTTAYDDKVARGARGEGPAVKQRMGMKSLVERRRMEMGIQAQHGGPAAPVAHSDLQDFEADDGADALLIER